MRPVGWIILTLILAAGAWTCYALGQGIGYEKGRWDCRREQAETLDVIDHRIARLETECRIVPARR